MDNLANSLLPQLSSVLANPILGASLFFIGAQNPNAEVLAKLEKMDAKLDTIILEIAKLYKLSVLTLDSVFEVELKKLYEELMAVKTVINDQKKAGNTAEAKEVSKTALLNALHEKVYGAYKRLAMEMIAKKKAGNTFVSIRPTVYDWYRHEFKCRGEFFGIRWDCYYDDAFAYFDFIEPAGRLSISATDLLILIKLQKLSLELHKVAYGNRSAATIAIAQRYADDIVNLHTIVKTDFEAVNEQLKSYEQRTYVNLWDSNLGPVTKEKALQIIREFIRKNYEPIFLAESALIAQKVQLRAVIETNKSP